MKVRQLNVSQETVWKGRRRKRLFKHVFEVTNFTPEDGERIIKFLYDTDGIYGFDFSYSRLKTNMINQCITYNPNTKQFSNNSPQIIIRSGRHKYLVNRNNMVGMSPARVYINREDIVAAFKLAFC